MSARAFLDMTNSENKSYPEYDWHHPAGRDSKQKVYKVNEDTFRAQNVPLPPYKFQIHCYDKTFSPLTPLVRLRFLQLTSNNLSLSEFRTRSHGNLKKDPTERLLD